MENSWVRIKDLNFYSIKVRGKTEWKFMYMGEQFFANTDHQIPGYAKYDDILRVR